MAVCPGNSKPYSRPFSICLHDQNISIIEGTRESLERLQLDYVDVIFAHRADINGWYWISMHNITD